MVNLLKRIFKKKYKIILIRHGQSEGNIDPRVYENKFDHQIALTPFGENQATEAGKKLKGIVKNKHLDVFVSPYKRTVQTYFFIKKGLNRNNITIEYDPRIREQEHKIFKNSEERTKIFAEQKKMGKFYYRFKNAEAGVDVYSRITTFLRELRTNQKLFNRTNDVVIIAHEIVLRAIIMRMYRLKDSQFDELPDIENCSPIILITTDFDRATISPLTTSNEHLVQYLSDK